MYQTQMQTQFQMQMQQANNRFEHLLASQGERRKKDPPMYEGKFGEDLELWIFAMEEYYANKRGLMEADTSDFVTMISSSLGKSVLNWYRAFSSDCEAAGVPKTWQLFKAKLRERFRPKDIECNLRERLFQMNHHGTIHEYVSSFQDPMSQSELEISEIEKRFYFQNGLRPETEKKVKELSPRFLHEVIEIATNFEFAHYGELSAKTTANHQPSSKAASSMKPEANNTSKPLERKLSPKSGPKEDWRKSATCHNCGQVGHIKPQCKSTKESNHYVGGSFNAILEVKALAYNQEEAATDVSIFVDNGSSLNGVTEDLAVRLQLDIKEHPDDMMTVRLGYNQTVQRPRRTVEMMLQIPDFPVTCETFTVMPVPEDKDVLLGMKWLRENNPDIDWERLLLRPRTRTEEPQTLQLVVPNKPRTRMIGGRRFKNANQNREIFHYYRRHGHKGAFGETKLITTKQFLKQLRKEKDIQAVFVVNPHDSEKAERFKQQGWEALVNNPAHEVLLNREHNRFR
ncbi:unnamed protein product [Phytophthora fragariaefolia]|uniref:Unnamed protein product n=1 Tax=Phytophthora fragariaefolia TaxID=1490495 RepID=A0A9W6YG72_9STRA|nr:unnamed protein product [Phytophthora fragariaefolia]